MIQITNLSFQKEEESILKQISLEIPKYHCIGILGANGSGKSSLLKHLYRFLEVKEGEIKVDGKKLENYDSKEFAQKMAVLIQQQNLSFHFRVSEIMEMGNYARKKKGSRKEMEEALALLGLAGYEDRDYLTLSGGEQQRLNIARCLYQDTEIIVLDEPSNHLDVKHQMELMDLLKSLQKTIVMVLHDINLASYYCDYLFAMKAGEICFEGKVEDFFQKEQIEALYGRPCDIILHPTRKKPVVLF